MFCQWNGVRKQIVIALCVYIGQLSLGYSLGWIASAIPKLQDPETSPLPDQITDFEMSLVGSIQYLGGLVGPAVAGYLSNVKGRKSCMYAGAFFSFVGYIMMARASTLVIIYIGRFLTGFGAGFVVVTALVYLGEISSTNIRGILLTGTGIFVTAGTLFAFSVGPYVSYSMSSYVGACTVIVYAAAVSWIPESPTFYALEGNTDLVQKVLKYLGRITDMDKVLSSEKYIDNLRDWKELLFIKGNRRALTISMVLGLSQQTSGLIAVTFYATSIFELSGSNLEPAIATIILGTTQLVGGLITPVFIERAGRKKLLFFSTSVCSLSMLCLGIYFYLTEIDHSAAPALNWLPLTALVLFFLSFDSGLGIIPSTLIGEMFEPNVRSKGCAVAVTMASLSGFAITTIFGSLISLVGVHVLFWCFSGFSALTFLYTFFFVPETKGKSLKEIREMLNK